MGSAQNVPLPAFASARSSLYGRRMTDTPLPVRAATPADVPALHALVERSYRGDAARAGWTHEADLIEGARTDAATLAAMIADPAQRLLLAHPADAAPGDAPVACVLIARQGNGTALLGMLCVDPAAQARGLGRGMIAAAETAAATVYGATRMEMTVIDRRPELIAYYARRGYLPTGASKPMPAGVGDTRVPLRLLVLARVVVPG
jgi:GNAT superfamily N-acetyltransferase